MFNSNHQLQQTRNPWLKAAGSFQAEAIQNHSWGLLSIVEGVSRSDQGAGHIQKLKALYPRITKRTNFSRHVSEKAFIINGLLMENFFNNRSRNVYMG